MFETLLNHLTGRGIQQALQEENRNMKTEIVTDNIKCESCVDTIKKGLKSFPEVSEVNVDINKEIVSVSYSDGFSLEKIKEKLGSMGYPVKNTLKGFDKLMADAKSYLKRTSGKTSNED
jgi:copper chaperone CopZ